MRASIADGNGRAVERRYIEDKPTFTRILLGLTSVFLLCKRLIAITSSRLPARR